MRTFTVLQRFDLKKDIKKRDLYKGVFIVGQIDLQLETCKAVQRESLQ